MKFSNLTLNLYFQVCTVHMELWIYHHLEVEQIDPRDSRIHKDPLCLAHPQVHNQGN